MNKDLDLKKILENTLTDELIEKSITEAYNATPVDTPLPAEDRSKLEKVYMMLAKKLPGYTVELNRDRIVIRPIAEPTADFDYTPYMKSILESMIEKGDNVKPLPKVQFIKEVSENILGPTAHYDPDNRKIVLYTENRHPKDVLRSFCHEMIHHVQNIEGRLHEIGTTDTNEDSLLEDLEKEAYLRGNMTFRKWEDSIKNK